MIESSLPGSAPQRPPKPLPRTVYPINASNLTLTEVKHGSNEVIRSSPDLKPPASLPIPLVLNRDITPDVGAHSFLQSSESDGETGQWLPRSGSSSPKIKLFSLAQLSNNIGTGPLPKSPFVQEKRSKSQVSSRIQDQPFSASCSENAAIYKNVRLKTTNRFKVTDDTADIRSARSLQELQPANCREPRRMSTSSVSTQHSQVLRMNTIPPEDVQRASSNPNLSRNFLQLDSGLTQRRPSTPARAWSVDPPAAQISRQEVSESTRKKKRTPSSKLDNISDLQRAEKKATKHVTKGREYLAMNMYQQGCSEFEIGLQWIDAILQTTIMKLSMTEADYNISIVIQEETRYQRKLALAGFSDAQSAIMRGPGHAMALDVPSDAPPSYNDVLQEDLEREFPLSEPGGDFVAEHQTSYLGTSPHSEMPLPLMPTPTVRRKRKSNVNSSSVPSSVAAATEEPRVFSFNMAMGSSVNSQTTTVSTRNGFESTSRSEVIRNRSNCTTMTVASASTSKNADSIDWHIEKLTIGDSTQVSQKGGYRKENSQNFAKEEVISATNGEIHYPNRSLGKAKKSWLNILKKKEIIETQVVSSNPASQEHPREIAINSESDEKALQYECHIQKDPCKLSKQMHSPNARSNSGLMDTYKEIKGESEHQVEHQMEFDEEQPKTEEPLTTFWKNSPNRSLRISPDIPNENPKEKSLGVNFETLSKNDSAINEGGHPPADSKSKNTKFTFNRPLPLPAPRTILNTIKGSKKEVRCPPTTAEASPTAGARSKFLEPIPENLSCISFQFSTHSNHKKSEKTGQVFDPFAFEDPFEDTQYDNDEDPFGELTTNDNISSRDISKGSSQSLDLEVTELVHEPSSAPFAEGNEQLDSIYENVNSIHRQSKSNRVKHLQNLYEEISQKVREEGKIGTKENDVTSNTSRDVPKPLVGRYSLVLNEFDPLKDSTQTCSLASKSEPNVNRNNNAEEDDAHQLQETSRSDDVFLENKIPEMTHNKSERPLSREKPLLPPIPRPRQKKCSRSSLPNSHYDQISATDTMDDQSTPSPDVYDSSTQHRSSQSLSSSNSSVVSSQDRYDSYQDDSLNEFGSNSFDDDLGSNKKGKSRSDDVDAVIFGRSAFYEEQVQDDSRPHCIPREYHWKEILRIDDVKFFFVKEDGTFAAPFIRPSLTVWKDASSSCNTRLELGEFWDENISPKSTHVLYTMSEMYIIDSKEGFRLALKMSSKVKCIDEERFYKILKENTNLEKEKEAKEENKKANLHFARANVLFKSKTPSLHEQVAIASRKSMRAVKKGRLALAKGFESVTKSPEERLYQPPQTKSLEGVLGDLQILARSLEDSLFKKNIQFF